MRKRVALLSSTPHSILEVNHSICTQTMRLRAFITDMDLLVLKLHFNKTAAAIYSFEGYIDGMND